MMNDLIYRQDAIKAVGYYHCHSGDKLLFADNALKELPSAHQWIPCGERIPAAYDRVLCFQPKTIGSAIWIGYFDIGGFWVSDDGCEQRTNPVKAWMPLPEPFEEDANETD